uniref:Uncharacterized protein n=1 Tax=Anopheles atroparvus TaxID=41427 RepID=A0A182IYG5_ANOAO
MFTSPSKAEPIDERVEGAYLLGAIGPRMGLMVALVALFCHRSTVVSFDSSVLTRLPGKAAPRQSSRRKKLFCISNRSHLEAFLNNEGFSFVQSCWEEHGSGWEVGDKRLSEMVTYRRRSRAQVSSFHATDALRSSTSGA